MYTLFKMHSHKKVLFRCKEMQKKYKPIIIFYLKRLYPKIFFNMTLLQKNTTKQTHIGPST